MKIQSSKSKHSGFSLVELLLVVFLTSLISVSTYPMLQASLEYAQRHAIRSQIINFLQECAMLSLRHSMSCNTSLKDDFILNTINDLIIRKEVLKKGNHSVEMTRKISWGLNYGQFVSGSFIVASPSVTMKIIVAPTGRIRITYQ